MVFHCGYLMRCAWEPVRNCAVVQDGHFSLRKRDMWWIEKSRSCIRWLTTIVPWKLEQPQMNFFRRQAPSITIRNSYSSFCRGHIRGSVWRLLQRGRAHGVRYGTEETSGSTRKTAKEEGRDEYPRLACSLDIWTRRTMCGQLGPMRHWNCVRMSGIFEALGWLLLASNVHANEWTALSTDLWGLSDALR